MEEKTDSARIATPARAVEGLESASAGKSYGQMLKSSMIIGGSSAANVLMGIVRVKVNAGLIGLYSSISQVAGTVSNLGSSSCVRQIAAAASRSARESRLVANGFTDVVCRTANRGAWA